jgi:hypothetical protein
MEHDHHSHSIKETGKQMSVDHTYIKMDHIMPAEKENSCSGSVCCY